MIAYRNPQYTNGRAAGSAQSVVELCDPVYYVSPLVTLTKRGYTNVAEVESRGSLLAMPRQGNVYGVKHYFEGERRICSAIGGGFTHVEWDSIDASQDKVVAPICDELFPLLDDGVEEAMHCVELNDIHLSGRLIYRMLWLEATKPQDDPEPVYYYHNDHLGGTAYLTDQTGQVAQTLAYLPYGEDWVDVTAFMYDTSQIGFYQFNGKEKDPETDYLYYGARYYWPDAWNGWLSPDPLMDKYPNISPYAYCNWNPVNLVDPDGDEPIKPFAGTVKGFVKYINGLSTGIGSSTGAMAHSAMLRMGMINGVMPANTAPFNTSGGNRYIYTKKGGWIDMAHFIFYAGRAYSYKQQKLQAQEFVKRNGFHLLSSETQNMWIKQANINPVSEAIQDGYLQEFVDRLKAPHSAYSYEDLPTDRFGAEFGASYFDPNSKRTFSEQIQDYLNGVLKATDPQDAPNYDKLPNEYPEKPSKTNKTTTPLYVE